MKIWGEIKAMSDLKEQAKKIIAKGKSLGDIELINMGLDMLEAYNPSEDILSIEPKAKDNTDVEITQQKPKSVMLRDAFDMSMFKTNKESNVSTKFGKKVAVSTSRHENKFLDDGTEAAELKGQTPDFKPSDRNRKVKMMEAICQVCGKKEIKNEIFVIGREFYRCESCLLKGKS